MEKVLTTYLESAPYADVLSIQEAAFNRLLKEKSEDRISRSKMELILCQHTPVYTLGKNGNEENLLGMAKQSDAEFFYTSRGGDITYHGPGQLVAYPILDLERLNMGLAKYIESLEDVIIKTIETYGLQGERLEGASGVWLDPNHTSRVRKICALGIRSSRFVTMHGLAFNINTDLTYFDYINPCGFTDRGVTSLEKEIGEKQDFQEVMNAFLKNFSEVFDVDVVFSEKIDA